MTPKEKAEELYDKYFDEMLLLGFHLSNRQICKISLIAVDEILEALKSFDITFNYILKRDYWLEVKQEIEKL